MLPCKILSIAACLALLTAGGLVAQSGATPQGKPSAPAQTAYVGPHISGTVVFWNGNRMDLKTRDGKTQEVAVNDRTERQVEIKKGAEVTVDYRRKVGKFVIARRVRPFEENQTAAQSPAQATKSLTGEVVSSNQAELLLRTGSGDVTFFLAPSTEYLVRPLGQGRRVTVEYKETAGGSKMAVRVSAASTASPGKPPGGGGPRQPGR
jgi:RNase P/RNase MRP subunit p29